MLFYYAKLILNMPVIKSAIKKLRQGRKHHEHNRSRRTGAKELVDAFRKKPLAKNLPKVVSALDKLAKRHIIHPHKAARLKSRLARLLS
jgi:small subunit ribosomal protein S20